MPVYMAKRTSRTLRSMARIARTPLARVPRCSEACGGDVIAMAAMRRSLPRCTACGRLGHQASDCYRVHTNSVDNEKYRSLPAAQQQDIQQDRERSRLGQPLSKPKPRSATRAQSEAGQSAGNALYQPPSYEDCIAGGAIVFGASAEAESNHVYRYLA